jgi:hypothetical protein
MRYAVYLLRRKKLLRFLREAGVKRPARMYRKLREHYEDQLDRMESHLIHIADATTKFEKEYWVGEE